MGTSKYKQIVFSALTTITHPKTPHNHLTHSTTCATKSVDNTKISGAQPRPQQLHPMFSPKSAHVGGQWLMWIYCLSCRFERKTFNYIYYLFMLTYGTSQLVNCIVCKDHAYFFPDPLDIIT